MASTIRSFGGNDDRNVNGSKQHGRYTQNDGTRLLTVIFYQRRLCTIRGQRTHTQHTGLRERLRHTTQCPVGKG
jgi:hypothetical protein